MEIRVLRYFLAVAREENIAAAAESLHITQPTLSRQLMDLEYELGTQLFHRGKRGQKIVLTEGGVFLRKRAEEILMLTDRTVQDFHSPDTDVAGDVYIAAGETPAVQLLARAAMRLRRAHPLRIRRSRRPRTPGRRPAAR